MFGILLNMDSGRQGRVGTDGVRKLFSTKAWNTIVKKQRLNSSLQAVPFAPTLVKPSNYPNFFRATDIRTVYWKVKNHDDFHDLSRVFVDDKNRLVLTFNEALKTKDRDRSDALVDLLHFGYGHFDLELHKTTKDKATFNIVQPETTYGE